MRLWSIGEVLWDVFPDQERLGGAPLNVCVNLHRLGDEAQLLSAVGHDRRGQLVLQQMRALGLSTTGINEVAQLPTGIAEVFTAANGDIRYKIPRPAAFDMLLMNAEVVAQAKRADLDWLYFGTLLQTTPEVENFTAELVQHLPGVRCFYDMNLREDHWNVPLVERLSRLCTVLKLNEDEAKALVPQIPALEAFCATWAEEFDIETICVTLGAAGSLVYQRNPQTNESSIVRVPGYSIQVQDTVGAGDAFAAAFLHGYHLGGPIVETAKMANAVGALVANRAGATPEWSVAECKAMMAAEAVQALRTHDAKFI